MGSGRLACPTLVFIAFECLPLCPSLYTKVDYKYIKFRGTFTNICGKFTHIFHIYPYIISTLTPLNLFSTLYILSLNEKKIEIFRVYRE
jgi:hypothetical protein